jgi:hypothetical protein
LNGSQLGGFLIFPEMSNFNSHPGIAGGLPKGNYNGCSETVVVADRVCYNF